MRFPGATKRQCKFSVSPNSGYLNEHNSSKIYFRCAIACDAIPTTALRPFIWETTEWNAADGCCRLCLCPVLGREWPGAAQWCSMGSSRPAWHACERTQYMEWAEGLPGPMGSSRQAVRGPSSLWGCLANRYTTWVAGCVSLRITCVCVPFFASPAMGDFHLAAPFSWDDARTFYFKFYTNSAPLSRCTFICSSDNSKDQHRCPWSQREPPLIWKGKSSLFFLFFPSVFVFWSSRILQTCCKEQPKPSQLPGDH